MSAELPLVIRVSTGQFPRRCVEHALQPTGLVRQKEARQRHPDSYSSRFLNALSVSILVKLRAPGTGKGAQDTFISTSPRTSRAIGVA